ncbi:MAG: hypothetical protein JSW50_02275 [Candidatus Latescibacterota bacterium]|nr:MAG: hypothetical protein JSW50_02275 [Candidatus Latescibacterota bacterium]
MNHLTRPSTLGAGVMVLLSLIAVVSPSAAQSDSNCECLDSNHPDYKTAVVWRGSAPTLTLPDIVTLAAPILWYSTDEPLIVMGDFPLPHAHPCDDPSDKGVTYYQVTKIMLRPGVDEVTIPEQDDPNFFEKTANFTVRYYFYYREDVGMNSHVHDLEVAEFEIALNHTESGCYEVELTRVTALAHGTDWYSNELQIRSEFVRLPIVLFVEEGKHATCPDRNADGIYTPGYDVNVRINDAWGVRDVFGSGWLIAPGYNAAMSKPRHPRFKMLPPDSPHRCEIDRFSSSLRDTTDLTHYELRPANTVVMCDDVPPDREFLLSMMTKHKFGAGNEPTQFKSASVKKLAEPLVGYGKMPSINLRWDRALGISLAARGLPIEAIYLVPRATWIFQPGEVSFEGMLSTSASRFMGSYISVGAAYEEDKFRNDEGGVTTNPDKRWNFVTETGVKFRFRLKGKIRLLTLGYQFAGVRFGLRFSGFDSLKNGRLIVEIGGGVW